MSTPIAADMLDILADPETHEPVSLASDKQLTALGKALEKGEAKRRDGQPFSGTIADIEGALLSQGGKVAYVIRDGIANFLVDERIELTKAL